MRTRPLKGTSITLTELGFGAAGFGNLYHETTDEESRAAIDAAWESGIRYFDTAPHYGLGLSERRLGEALAGYPRSEYVVSTKVGRLLVPNENPVGRDDQGFAVPDDLRREWDVSRGGILRSVEESLHRLGLDSVDILYVHDPDLAAPGAGAEAVETLVELRRDGVVKAIGVGTNSAEEAQKLLETTEIDLAMLAGRYTLLEQDALDSAMAAADRLGKSIVAVGVFNSGILARPRPGADATYNYSAAPTDLVQKANAIADICSSHGVTLPEAAIAFALDHPAVADVTLGMRTAEHVQRNVELYAARVPQELWKSLEAAGLLRTPSVAHSATV